MTIRIQFDLPVMASPPFHGLPFGVSRRGLLAWARAVIRRWRERRVLEVLDERMLRDIGVSRSQALAEAAKPWWRS